MSFAWKRLLLGTLNKNSEEKLKKLWTNVCLCFIAFSMMSMSVFSIWMGGPLEYEYVHMKSLKKIYI
jgi:hypothetical protein